MGRNSYHALSTLRVGFHPLLGSFREKWRLHSKFPSPGTRIEVISESDSALCHSLNGFRLPVLEFLIVKNFPLVLIGYGCFALFPPISYSRSVGRTRS